MGLAARRQLLIWTAIPLLVGQVGCATQGVRVQPSQSSAMVSEADRKLCERLAETQAAGVKGKSVGRGVAEGFGEGFIAGIQVMGVGWFLTAPLGAIWGGVEAGVESSKLRKAAHDSAMQACLEPIILEQKLGPEHPDVAHSLHRLAVFHMARDARAEPFYKRALAIREKALGPEHVEVARVLEDYAVLLRKLDRGTEADEMEARAKAIREKPQESQTETQPALPQQAY